MALTLSGRAVGAGEERLELRELSGDEEAFYSVSVAGVPVGVATAASEGEESAGPREFDMKILTRVGANLVVARLGWSRETKGERPGYRVASSYEWKGGTFLAEKGSIVEEGERLLGNDIGRMNLASLLLAEPVVPQDEPVAWGKNSSFFLFRPTVAKKEKLTLVSPFGLKVFSLAELNAQFDKDGFAKSVSLPFSKDMALDFKRVDAKEIRAVAEQATRLPIDLQWFSSSETIRGDLLALRQKSDACIGSDEKSERDLKRSNPNLPYLLHRKLVNLSNLCRLLNGTLSKAQQEGWPPEKTLARLADDARSLEKEARRELPVAFSMTPEWSVLGRPELKWQYPRVLRFLMVRAQNEVDSLLAIEQERKVDVIMSVRAVKQEMRAVLRGSLKVKDASFRVRLERIRDEEQLGNATGSKVSGLDFAQGLVSVQKLSETCASGGGEISFDLLDAQPRLVRSEFVRGVWDAANRVVMIPDFLQAVAAIPNCRRVAVYVRTSMAKDASAALEHFLRDVLQVENEMQISNGREKRIRLIPGTYELSLRSFVSGAQIGKQDFSVEAQARGKSRLALRFE
jgi:hypothetical protein